MLSVELPKTFTSAEKLLVLRYVNEAQRFSPPQWVAVLRAFTTLGDSHVRIDGSTMAFQGFYQRAVDEPFGDAYIADIVAEPDVSVRAPAIQAGYARRIYQRLRGEPFSLGGTPETQCLLAYCLYWWASFARGYAFELTILRDLESARIRFAAHDLRVREERFSPCDLTLLGMTGDIKNTTYFLHVARSFPLTCDFYVTRVYDGAARRYVRIVLLTADAWRRVNGPTLRGDLAHVTELLPEPVGVTFLGYHLVVVDYELWKQKVLQRQTEGGNPQ